MYCTGLWMSLCHLVWTLLQILIFLLSLLQPHFVNFFFSYFAPSPLALTFSHCLFFCIFLSSLFSLPLWKVLSKSTLCTKAVWWHKLAAGQRSALWLFLLLCEQQSLNLPSPHSPLSTSLFVFLPPLSFLCEILNTLAQMFPFKHTHTLWGDWGAVGLGASERGVSGDPLELVCEGLVNWIGGKNGKM